MLIAKYFQVVMICWKKKERKKIDMHSEVRLRNACIVCIIFQFSFFQLFTSKTNNINFISYERTKTFPYTINWYTDPINDLDPHDKRCQLCDFTLRNRKSNSNRDDFLMTTLISKHIGFEPLIRNVRTTQTNAKFIIFIDQSVQENLTKFEKQLSNHCGVNLINVGEIPKYEHFAYCFLRFYIYYDFITSYSGNINRIILFDAMDTLFQGDPFYEDFTPDMFILTLENRKVNESVWALDNYIKYYIKTKQENNTMYYNSSMVNCGLILGGKKSILIFINAFKYRLDVDELLYQLEKMDYVDQAILHSLVIDGELEKRGLNITFQTVYDDYVSISIGPCGWKCPKKAQNDYSVGNYVSKKTGKYPLIVHQFTRYYHFSVSYYKACPPIEKNVSPRSYIKDFPKRYKKYLMLK